MRKKPNLSPQEIAIFRQAVRGVKPLMHSKVRLLSKKHPPSPVPTLAPDPFIPEIAIYECPKVRSEETISFKRTGIQDKVLRNLRRGQYNVEETLDLHGMSIAMAKTALECFLQHCLLEHKRVVLIIHGKGRHSPQPILKNKMNQWLRQIETVLAFTSANVKRTRRCLICVIKTKIESLSWKKNKLLLLVLLEPQAQVKVY